MADEKKEVVLKITFDSKEAEKRQAEIVSLLASQNKGYRELQASVNKAGKATADEARQLVAYRANIAALNTEHRGLTRNIELHNIQIENSAESTIAMRARLSELTQALIRHSKAEIDASESLSAMRQEAKDLSDQLKENESSWGDNRRNVGAYTQGILQAVDGTGLLATVTENLEGAQKAYNATLTVMKAGLAGNISMLKLFKLAMAATGIGAVVLLLGGLVSFLTRTQEGIDFVSRATKGFTTMLGFLTDKLSDVGKKVFDAFSNPKQALIDLVDFIQTNLLNRLKSFAVILEGIQNRDFTKLSDGLFQLSTGVTDMSKKTAQLGKEMMDVAKAGAEVEKEFQRIRDAERALNVERSKSKAEIERLKFISEDANKSEAERIAAAEKAFAMEKSFLDRSLKLQNDKIKNIEQEQSLTNNLSADNDKLAEERIKLAELEEESFGRQTELNNKLNDLRKQSAEKRATEEKEAMERRLEQQKLEIELEIAQSQEGSQKRLDAEIKMLALERDQKQKEYKRGSVGYVLAQQQFQNESLKLTQEFTQKGLDEEKKRLDEFVALTNKEYSEAQEVTQDYYKKKQTEAANDFANGITSQEQYNEQLKNIEGELLNQQIQNAIDYGQSTVDLEQQAADRRIAIRQNEADKKKAIQEAEFATAQAMAGAFTELANLVAGQGEELSDFQKAAALFQIGIDTASSLSALTLTSAKVSGSVATASGPFGVVTGPLAYAAYYGTGLTTILSAIGRAKQLLSAESPSAPQFYDGGFTSKGNPREQATNLGSRPYVYHKSEYVAPHDVLADPAGAYLVNQLESIRLRKRGFADGGFAPAYNYNVPVPYDHFAAAARHSLSGGGMGQPIDYKALAQELSKVQIVTKVSDVKAGLDKAEMKQGKTDI